MKKYYLIEDSDWGYPLGCVNLNRYFCDCYFEVVDGELRRTVKYTNLKTWRYLREKEVKPFLEKYAISENEITEEMFEEARIGVSSGAWL